MNKDLFVTFFAAILSGTAAGNRGNIIPTHIDRAMEGAEKAVEAVEKKFPPEEKKRIGRPPKET